MAQAINEDAEGRVIPTEQELEAEKAELQSELDDAAKQIGKLEDQVEQLTDEINKAKDVHEELQELYDGLKEDYKELQAQKDLADEYLDRVRMVLDDLANRVKNEADEALDDAEDLTKP